MKKTAKIAAMIVVIAMLISVPAILFYSHSDEASASQITIQQITGRVSPIDDAAFSRAERFGGSFSAWLDSAFNPSIASSVVAGVVMGDRLVFHHGVNADLDTPFGIASLSKTFTAVLVLRLAQEGLLSLDDPVSRYLPGVVIERHDLNSVPVTIRHLLAHTSGMPSYGPMISAPLPGGGRIGFPRQAHPAGFSYSYNNEGYVILMHLIEAAAGRPYGDLMREKVLEPLNMTASTAAFSNGTGGLRTTLRDLAKYTVMLVNGGVYRGSAFLTPGSYAEMLQQSVELPPSRVDYYYSLSWEVITVGGVIDSYYKAGRWFNEASCIQVFPRKGVAMMYLCNPPHHLSDSFMRWRQGLTGALRGLLRNITEDRGLCSQWPSHNPQELQRYAGSYQNEITGERIQITYRQGTLFSVRNGVSVPLRSFTSNRFTRSDGRGIHDFVWRDSSVVGLSLQSGYYRAQ